VGRWKTALDHGVAIAAAGAILGLGAIAFAYSGLFEVEASKPHSWLIDWTTKTTMTHSVRRHAIGIEAPATASSEQVIDGFCQFEKHCVACHGAPAVPRESWANGMTPDPPYLVDARSKWRPRELYWIVRNGIKMTGMPAWEREMSQQQTWDVVAFLGAMPKLPSGTYVSWRAAGLCGAAPAVSVPPRGAQVSGLPRAAAASVPRPSAPAAQIAQVRRSPPHIVSRPAPRPVGVPARTARPASPPPPPKPAPPKKSVGPQ
jgi:mono/diheme cytochrome c family protein